LIGHDPRLPMAVWGSHRSGMRDLVKAFHRFEKRVGPRADAFVKHTLDRLVRV
jgi:DNA-binding transcriptional regulator PaaX